MRGPRGAPASADPDGAGRVPPGACSHPGWRLQCCGKRPEEPGAQGSHKWVIGRAVQLCTAFGNPGCPCLAGSPPWGVSCGSSQSRAPPRRVQVSATGAPTPPHPVGEDSVLPARHLLSCNSVIERERCVWVMSRCVCHRGL